MKNRQWRLAAEPIGAVRSADFTLVEHELPEIEEDELVVGVRMLAFDPALLGRVSAFDLGQTRLRIGDLMRAEAFGEVVASRNSDFSEGDRVVGPFGWQERALITAEGIDRLRRVPEDVEGPLALSVLGASGLAAYFGILEVGEPKEEQTVVVSGAAGATGSVAAQIARHVIGAFTIGIAGGRDKCGWLDHVARVDRSVDYKAADVRPQLDEALGDRRIHVFFDNVGGLTLDAGLERLATHGRVVLSGAMSRYNAPRPGPGPEKYTELIVRRGRMEGFAVEDYRDRFEEAQRQLRIWVDEDKVRFDVDVQEGFDSAPRAFLRLFDGSNRGKQLLRL